jgi:hypothetical protein
MFTYGGFLFLSLCCFLVQYSIFPICYASPILSTLMPVVKTSCLCYTFSIFVSNHTSALSCVLIVFGLFLMFLFGSGKDFSVFNTAAYGLCTLLESIHGLLVIWFWVYTCVHCIFCRLAGYSSCIAGRSCEVFLGYLLAWIVESE